MAPIKAVMKLQKEKRGTNSGGCDYYTPSLLTNDAW